MGLSNELSCEAGSFTCCHLNPHRFFQSEVLRLYMPALEPWVAQSVSIPSCSSRFIHTRMWDRPLCELLPRLVHQLLPSRESSLPQMPIFAPPTGLGKCFFFNSLVVGLPCSSIFWQFWLFFDFKFAVVLLVVRGGTVCLPTPPSWLEACPHEERDA